MITNKITSLEYFNYQIGILACEMNLVRSNTLNLTKKLTEEELDFNFDSQSNSIGTLLLHIAALEIKFQLNHFNRKLTNSELEIFNKASPYNMNKRLVFNNNLDYYIKILKDTRIITITELKKLNDDWLLKEIKTSDGNTIGNNHYLIKHIINDEISHQGQIKMILKRLG